MNLRTLVATTSLFFAAFAQAASADVIRLSEPVAVTDTAEIFGALLDDNARVVSLAKLLEEPEAFVNSAVRVDARISEVCQKKGCFMIATVGEYAVRISFRDYAFFVPTDTGGKTVTLTGELVERTLSEQEAAHFREDAGSDSVHAGRVYEFVADAVSVPRA